MLVLNLAFSFSSHVCTSMPVPTSLSPFLPRLVPAATQSITKSNVRMATKSFAVTNLGASADLKVIAKPAINSLIWKANNSGIANLVQQVADFLRSPQHKCFRGLKWSYKTHKVNLMWACMLPYMVCRWVLQQPRSLYVFGKQSCMTNVPHKKGFWVQGHACSHGNLHA